MFALSAVLLLCLAYLITSLHTYRKLSAFPGPFFARFSNIHLFRTALSGRAFEIRQSVRKQYGEGLIRIGPDMLVTDSPTIFRHVHAVHNKYTRGDWYAVMRFDPYQQTMLSSPDMAFHDEMKMRMAAAYSGREVPSLETDINEQLVQLKYLLKEKYATTEGEPVREMDWGLVAQYFTLDALTKVAYGEAFGYLEKDEDVHQFISTAEMLTPFFALCSDVSLFGKILLNKYVLRLAGPKTTDRTGLGVTMAIAKNVVNARLQAGEDAKGQLDMLGSFLRHGIPPRQCEAELPTQLLAGSDTTANVLRIGLLLIVTTPRVYMALQKEIDDGIASGQISNPITAAEGKRLKYLQAFLWECLRFNPPVSLLLPKVVPSAGDTLEGKFVPSGTKIGVDFNSMGRRKGIFGEDADIFRPERFLEATEQQRLVMEKTADLMFGYGRFSCTGRTVAWLEMNTVFIELLREFDFQIVDVEKPMTRSHWALFVIRNMRMRVTRRKV